MFQQLAAVGTAIWISFACITVIGIAFPSDAAAAAQASYVAANTVGISNVVALLALLGSLAWMRSHNLNAEFGFSGELLRQPSKLASKRTSRAWPVTALSTASRISIAMSGPNRHTERLNCASWTRRCVLPTLRPAYAAALACYARELCVEVAEAEGLWPADDSRELYAWNRFNASKNGVEANWIDPAPGVAQPVKRVVLDDLERLARRTTEPGFDQACKMIEELMRDGGQARWLRSHIDSGSGMNDLARAASEMFEDAPPGPLSVASAPMAEELTTDRSMVEVRA